MGLAGTEGFAMVGKQVRSREVREVPPAACFFIQSHGRHLRIGKDHVGVEPIVHPLRHRCRMGRIVASDLSLLYRNMYNRVQIIDIADGKNMRLRCPHLFVQHNATVPDRHPRRLQI